MSDEKNKPGTNLIFKQLLAYPPSVNNYYKIARNRIYVSSKGKAYRKDLVKKYGVSKTPSKERIALTIYVYCPDARKRDIDNVQKCLLDALTAIQVWEDDSQVDQIFIKRGPIRKGGAVLVKIREIKKK